MAATLTLIGGNNATSGSGNIYTFTAQPVGTPSPNRRVIFTLSGENNVCKVLSATVNGLPATIHTSILSNSGQTSCFSILLPTGTTADVLITMDGTIFFSGYITTYTIDNSELVNGEAPTVVTATATGSNINLTYTGKSGAPLVFSAGMGFSEKQLVSINKGLIQSVSDRVKYHAYLNGDFDGTQTITLSWNGPSGGSASAVYWEPVRSGVDTFDIDVFDADVFDAVAVTPTLKTYPEFLLTMII